jgi:hypothetical protein
MNRGLERRRSEDCAGRRESSEDDLSLRFTVSNDDGGRGLYPPSAEPDPQQLSMGMQTFVSLEQLQTVYD